MSLPTNSLEIFQAAMPMVGASPPASMDDMTPEAIAARSIYEIMVGASLSRQAWSFATKSATLTYQNETDSLPAFAYALPEDVLTPRVVLYAKRRFRDFEIRGTQLLCNLNDTPYLEMVYNWRATENLWPPDFTLSIVTRLAGFLATGLLDREQQGANLAQEAERLLRVAKRFDRSRFQGPDVAPDPILIQAWTGTRGASTVQALASISSGSAS